MSKSAPASGGAVGPGNPAQPLDAPETRSPAGRATRMRRGGRAALAAASVTLLSLVVVAAVFVDPRPPVAPPPAGPPWPPPPPCAWLSNIVLEQRAERWWATVEADLRGGPLPQTGQAIDTAVQEAFAPVYVHIPEFLDWHYSVPGQYTQLALAVAARLQEWGFPRVLVERLAGSALIAALLEWLQGWEPTRATLERLAGLEPLAASAVEQLDRFRLQVDERLFSGLSDRVRRASDEVERVMRAEMRALIDRRIQNEAELVPAGADAGADSACPVPERIQRAYEALLEAAVPDTIRRFTGTAAPTGILSVAAGVRTASAARALMRGLSARLSRRLLPGMGRLLGIGVGAGTWLLLDSLVILADEYFTREQFQQELTALVDEQRAGLRADLSAQVDEIRVRVTLGPVAPVELGGPD